MKLLASSPKTLALRKHTGLLRLQKKKKTLGKAVVDCELGALSPL